MRRRKKKRITNEVHDRQMKAVFDVVFCPFSFSFSADEEHFVVMKNMATVEEQSPVYRQRMNHLFRHIHPQHTTKVDDDKQVQDECYYDVLLLLLLSLDLNLFEQLDLQQDKIESMNQ